MSLDIKSIKLDNLIASSSNSKIYLQDHVIIKVINSKNEIMCQICAYEAGLSPKIYSTEYNIIAMEYVKCVTYSSNNAIKYHYEPCDLTPENLMIVNDEIIFDDLRSIFIIHQI